MPKPDPDIGGNENVLISDELSYDREKLKAEHDRDIVKLTEEQRKIYDEIVDAVVNEKGGVFFVYGFGGTGKTFMWRLLSAAIRFKGEICLNTASSGIASLLLQGGRTAHSRFSRNDQALTPDFLNTIKVSGLPNHSLRLKVGCPVMLLRNIDHTNSLMNGTRLQITEMDDLLVKAKVITGEKVGKTVVIPRLSITPSDNKLPFKMRRRQLLIAVAFAITINKSQGQSLSHVGLYLPRDVFQEMSSLMDNYT
uniref:ATP-dependent DNA helicase n=1 Tax=Brassica oleracea var. oleracea TaxID=109376 RepID=A0A0D3CNQ2_BRAOL